MKIEKSQIKRILLITLSNIGDVILTTPVISILEREFPHARLDIMVGPLGKDIFRSHPRIFKIIVYDKHTPVKDKRRLIYKLRRMKYDLIVDLRNTLFPLLVGSRYRTSPIHKIPQGKVIHKRDWHLWKLKQLGIDTDNSYFSIFVSREDQDYIDNMVSKIPEKERLVVVSPGAKSLIKRWTKEGFAKLCDKLVDELDISIIMIGDETDRKLIDEIESLMENKVYNLVGRTTIPQLACLLKRCRLLITNDSAPLHMGSAMGTRVLAIFGPTDPLKYGPQSRDDRVVRKRLHCSPCEVAECKFDHECMKSISADEVFEVAKKMFLTSSVQRIADKWE